MFFTKFPYDSQNVANNKTLSPWQPCTPVYYYLHGNDAVNVTCTEDVSSIGTERCPRRKKQKKKTWITETETESLMSRSAIGCCYMAHQHTEHISEHKLCSTEHKVCKESETV